MCRLIKLARQIRAQSSVIGLLGGPRGDRLKVREVSDRSVRRWPIMPQLGGRSAAVHRGTAWSAKCYMNMRPLYQQKIVQTETVA